MRPRTESVPGEEVPEILRSSRNGRLKAELFGIYEVDVLRIEEREPSIGSDCREIRFPARRHRTDEPVRSDRDYPGGVGFRKSSEEVATKRVHPEIQRRAREHHTHSDVARIAIDDRDAAVDRGRNVDSVSARCGCQRAHSALEVNSADG